MRKKRILWKMVRKRRVQMIEHILRNIFEGEIRMKCRRRRLTLEYFPQIIKDIEYRTLKEV